MPYGFNHTFGCLSYTSPPYNPYIIYLYSQTCRTIEYQARERREKAIQLQQKIKLEVCWRNGLLGVYLIFASARSQVNVRLQTEVWL